MDEALLIFLRDLMEMRDTLIERLAPEIEFSAQLASSCLTNDGKIFTLGAGDSSHIASLFERQLIDQYRIERPNLPCIALSEGDHSADKESFSASQLKALAKPDDCLIVFSSLREDHRLQALLDIAIDRGLTIVLIGPASSSGLKQQLQDNDLDISIDVTHKAHLLDCQLSIALAIAGLIDFQLFGSDL
jgi:D-sedoheptulose 7-phosphate isomerase|tara:strand:- start:114963 stop:115529 length:567 start_codon:yes stop_codon:yes gene_type:complete